MEVALKTRQKQSDLAADAKSFKWVEAEPAAVPCLSKALHELGVQRLLNGREPHQDHKLLLIWEVVSQHVMTSPAKDKSDTDTHM